MLEKPEIRYRDFCILETYIKKVSDIKKDSSCSIVIEAKLGDGKTEFIKNWQTYLSGKNIKTIYYDAWEYDSIESPLLPLLVKIAELIEDKDDKAFISYAKELLRATYVSTAKYLVGKAFGVDSPVDKILTEGIDALKDHEVKNYYKDLENEYSLMSSLSDKLNELVSKSEQKIYIFVDELDRCRPDFAIRILESINHFFSFPKITYIFAVDVEQLSYLIQNVYGERIDTSTYLRKFFDFVYELRRPSIKQYTKDVLVKCTSNFELNQEMISYICSLLGQFKLSLQDINYICKHIGIFLDHYKSQLNNNPDAVKYYLYFLTIRHLYYVDYKKLVHGDYVYSEISSSDSLLQIKKSIPSNLDILFKGLSAGKGKHNREDIIDKFKLLPPSKNMPFYEYIESIMNYSIVFKNV